MVAHLKLQESWSHQHFLCCFLYLVWNHYSLGNDGSSKYVENRQKLNFRETERVCVV